MVINDGSIRVRARDDNRRCIRDLLYIFNSKSYINEKGYLTKLVDKLHDLGYYEDNESLFIRPKG